MKILIELKFKREISTYFKIIFQIILNKINRLVQKDDKYELAIEKNTGNLVFRSLNDDNRPKSYVIARNVDSIWLHRFHTVFYNHSNSTTYAAHSLYNTIAAYKFFIEWDGSDRGYPNSQVKQLNDID